MGFYKDKLKEYSKVNVTPEVLNETRAKIILTMRAKYEELVEDMKKEDILSKPQYCSLTIFSNETILKCKKLEEDLGFVSVLNDDDFYTYLKNMEVFNLSNKINKGYEKKLELHDAMNKFRNKKGVSAKISTLFGGQEKYQKNKQEYNDLAEKLLQLSDTLKEFQGLTEEQVLKYMVGRFEVDKKYEFDEKTLFDYFAKNKQSEQEGGEPQK